MRNKRSWALVITAIVLIIAFQNFSATNPGMLLNYAQIQRITGLQAPYANIDGPMSNYIGADGNRTWLMPFNYNDGIYLAKTKTNFSSGFDNLLGMSQVQSAQWNLYSNYTSFPGHWWLVSTYQINANPVELISFVHVECLNGPCSRPGGYSTRQSGIGLAYYKEGYNNNQFRFLGLAVIPYQFPDDFNVQGAPYLISGGNIYMYYSDRDTLGYPHVAVARTSLSSLIQAARSGGLTPVWKKYRLGAWTEPGLGGNFTGLEKNTTGNGIPIQHIVHSGALYSRYTKKYYLTTYVNANQAAPFEGWPKGNGVFLFESTDLLNWNFKATLIWAGTPPIVSNSPLFYAPGFEYLNLTSTSTTAWSDGTAGQSFFVFAHYDAGSGSNKMSTYRSTVYLNSSDCAGGPSKCGPP